MTGESYTYDANGNTLAPTCKCRCDHARGRRVDLHPNLRRRSRSIAAGENRLISVTVSGQTTQFIYDGDGNLVKKVKPDGSKTIYVGGVYEVDKNSGGSVTRTVTYYPAAGAMRIDSTLYYVLKDHLGSASVVTNASGATVGEQRYYPFGETRLTTGTIFTDRLFTGQREITGLGIYDYGARFYSPKLGRFLSADTIVPGYANPQNLNRYSYANNNPLKYTDPSGHRPDDGCRTEGCNLTSLQKAIDAQKVKQLQQESDDRKCAKGNKNYCSGWDNWAWDTLPSAIVIHKGASVQLGFGGEFGPLREVGYVYNWRSFEFDTMYTQGRYAYLGTPQLAGGGYYKGITFVYGASSNASITGNSNAAGGAISLDSGGTLNATYQQSIAVDEDGLRLIDRRSGRPIQGYQFSLGVGGNLLVNAADAGGLLTEENTQIGPPTAPIENVLYQILRFLP